MRISGIFERFQYFNFETKILGNKNLLKKKLQYSLLVEGIKIENALLSCKTTILEANFKTNRMVRTKWTYHKGHSFVSNCFIFLKMVCQFKNLLQRVDSMYQPKCPYLFFL